MYYMWFFVFMCRMHRKGSAGVPFAALSIPFLMLAAVFLFSCASVSKGVSRPTSAKEAAGPEGRGGEAEASSRGDADAGAPGLTERPSKPMGAFFSALKSLEDDGTGIVRVLHYGDSHTAADFLTTAIRRSLQKRFGDGGRGFVYLGKPWRAYRPSDVFVPAKGGWQARRIIWSKGRDEAGQDGRFGLGGIAVDADNSKAVAKVVIPPNRSGFGRRISALQVFYLKQPNGGSLTVRVDGRGGEVVATAGEAFSSGIFTVELTDGMQSAEIRLRGDGPVRLFGAVLETVGPGVVYDSLGINGAFFYTSLRWDANLLAEQIRHRDPKLIIAMYGSNEAESSSLTATRYQEVVQEAIGVFRAGAPEASCLLIGPPDKQVSDDTEGEPDRLAWIIQVQRDVARGMGCGFIDTRDLMGGPGSHAEWRSRGWAKSDGVHLTVRGYGKLGQLLAEHILGEYENYFEGDSKEDDLKTEQ